MPDRASCGMMETGHDLKNVTTLTSAPEVKSFLMFIYFEKERQSVSRGGAERQGDTESEAGSRLRAVSIEPNAGLELKIGRASCRERVCLYV